MRIKYILEHVCQLRMKKKQLSRVIVSYTSKYYIEAIYYRLEENRHVTKFERVDVVPLRVLPLQSAHHKRFRGVKDFVGRSNYTLIHAYNLATWVRKLHELLSRNVTSPRYRHIIVTVLGNCAGNAIPR